MNSFNCSRLRQRGVTLIELMVVVVILSILVAIAYPSYTTFVTRSKRQAAKNMIYAVADRQEQFFQDNKFYAEDLAELGYGAVSIGIDDSGERTAAGAADRTYIVVLVDTSPTAYTVTAVPQLIQATRDADCGTLSLTHDGVRGPNVENCW